MTNYFTYNGRDSSTYGIRIKSKSIYSAPKLDASFISIPGRNGDLIDSKKRFANVQVSYTCFVPAKTMSELSSKLTNIKKWLYEKCDEYHSLTDSYDLTFERQGVFNSKLDITEEAKRIGTFTVSFNCKPQRYFITGTVTTILTGGTTILANPYPFNALPYMKIYPSENTLYVTITIKRSSFAYDGKTWTFRNINGFVEADSELSNFFKEGELRNAFVEGKDFPILYPGANYITITGSPRVEIKTRWWTL